MSRAIIPRTASMERRMKARVTLITLGVDDLERPVEFYRDGLGLPTRGIVGKEFDYGAVAFFDLQPGLKLAVWPRSSLAKDAGSSPRRDLAQPTSPSVTIWPARRRSTSVMAQAEKAGAKIVQPPGTHSGAVMPATSRTLTGTCGSRRGTRPTCRRIEWQRLGNAGSRPCRRP